MLPRKHIYVTTKTYLWYMYSYVCTQYTCRYACNVLQTSNFANMFYDYAFHYNFIMKKINLQNKLNVYVLEYCTVQ